MVPRTTLVLAMLFETQASVLISVTTSVRTRSFSMDGLLRGI